VSELMVPDEVIDGAVRRLRAIVDNLSKSADVLSAANCREFITEQQRLRILVDLDNIQAATLRLIELYE